MLILGSIRVQSGAPSIGFICNCAWENRPLHANFCFQDTCTILPRCYALLAVTPCSLLRPPPPYFRAKLLYRVILPPLHAPPPPAGRSSRFTARYCSSCTCTRVASVEELYLCIKHVENSLRTGLGLFR